jgi:hypothetical protein
MTRLTIAFTALTFVLAIGTAAPRAAATQQKPDQKKSDAPAVAGTWTLSAETPHGAMDFTLTLKQDGEKLTGTFVTQGGEIPVAGEAAKGTLTFKMTKQPENYPMLSFKARLKDDGSMTGTMSSDNGDMAFTGKRAK